MSNRTLKRPRSRDLYRDSTEVEEQSGNREPPGETRGLSRVDKGGKFDDGTEFGILHEGTADEKLFYWHDGEKKYLVKLTADELATQDKERQYRVSRTFQEARMMDTRAAELVAGAAGLKMRGVIWVDCSMESEWFNKEDETKLMQLAWQTVEEQNQLSVEKEHALQTAPGTFNAVRQNYQSRLKTTSNILKQFRLEQRSMKVFSLSPQVQSAMSKIVIDTIAEVSQLQGLSDPKMSMYSDRAISDENDDRTRRLCRVFRRLPLTRNEFCRFTGTVVLHNMSLQEGSAMTTYRLRQVKDGMQDNKIMWMMFVNANLDAIMREIRFVWDGTGFSKTDEFQKEMYTFDWYSHMMRKLDTVQNAVMLGPLIDNAAHRVENDMDVLQASEMDLVDTNTTTENKEDAGESNNSSVYTSSSWYR